MAFMKRVRLDDELISQGICADRADALRTLMAGLVSSGGERLTSPGLKVTPGLPLHVKGHIPYVGRGGLKLEGALDAFCIDPTGLACLDVGCSTGGFTDCLLKRGAALEQAISKAAGRAAYVQAGKARGVDTKRIERTLELKAAAPNVRNVPLYVQRQARRHLEPRRGQTLAAARNQAGHKSAKGIRAIGADAL